MFPPRPETAADAHHREKVELGEEVAKVEAFYGAAAADAGVGLRISGKDGLCARLDRTLFQQAVGNLMSNAIAHTPAGGSVDIAARVDRDRLTVTVSDTGCGIAPEHLPHVFERFYRVDRARTSSAQNVGLGLAVVKSIATRHGGHVEIDSEVGRGTRISMILPAAG